MDTNFETLKIFKSVLGLDSAIDFQEEEQESSSTMENSWPILAPEALFGLAGDIVRTIEPHSEADPAAILIQTLVTFGNIIGRGPHFAVEADNHYFNLFCMLVGLTSKGRKGTSLGQVLRLFKAIDEPWSKERLLSGLSSGEGLIWAVRDQIERLEPIKEKGRIVDYQTLIIDRGIEDKRLITIEAESSSMLRVMSREGNILSAILRQCWDTGNIRTLAKNSPATSTGAHVSLIGHITQDELRRELDSTQAGNGFANRFLWVCVKRSQCLPDGGELDKIDFAPILQRLTRAIDHAKTIKEMKRDSKAGEVWHAVYPTLSEGQPGLFGAVTSRAEAQVMRLACLYALLDISSYVGAEHLQAALALWTYCEDSARYIFGDSTGDPVADTILRALRGNPNGLTRTEIRDLFDRHKKKSEIDRSLNQLATRRVIEQRSELTDGRPIEKWFAVKYVATKAT